MPKDSVGGEYLFLVQSEEMRNRRYMVVVRPYLLGQFRIQVGDVTRNGVGSATAPWADCVQEI